MSTLGVSHRLKKHFFLFIQKNIFQLHIQKNGHSQSTISHKRVIYMANESLMGVDSYHICFGQIQVLTLSIFVCLSRGRSVKPEDKPKIMDWAVEMLDCIDNDSEFLRNQVFSDECTFHGNGTVNRHNNVYWSDGNPGYVYRKTLIEKV